MALVGNGLEYDKTFLAGASLRTTTSQYLIAGIESTSTSADFTVYLTGAGSTPASSITSRSAIGVVQSYQSSGSTEVTVRMFGISKAKCAASIACGSFVVAYEGASTTTFAGHLSALVESSIATTVTISNTVAVVTPQLVLGRALEAGSTNTVISIMISPAPYSRINLSTT